MIRIIRPERTGFLGQLCGIVNAEFALETMPVCFDCSAGAIESFGCSLGGQPVKEQPEDLGFHVRQCFTRVGFRPNGSVQGFLDG
jgi:hypothetical protein